MGEVAEKPKRERRHSAAHTCASLELRDTFPERDQRALGFLDRPHTLRRDLKKPLRPAAALGRRLADRRGDETVALEPIERGVDRGDDDLPPAGALDFGRDGHAIGRVADPQRRQENHQLEVGQQVPRPFN